MESPLPTLQSWLLGQCHREDAVGTLARLTLAQREDVEKRGFEAWLEQHVAGIVMVYAVEQARAEYAACLAELKSTGHSPSFPSWRVDRVVENASADAWARHRAEPGVSADDYVRRKRRELRGHLDKLARPYIDTCHWIRMREVVMNDPRMNARYVPVLAKLRELKSAGKILCPFSFPVYVELNRQTSDETRRAMARLIDELSDGVCLEPPNVIEQVELRRQVLQSVFGPGAPDLNEWIWTKAAWVCGQALPEATAFSPEDQNTIKKVFTDHVWNSRLSDLVEFSPTTPMPPFLENLAAKFGQDAKIYREQKATYQRVWQEEKTHLVGRLVREALPRIADEIWRQFPKESAAAMKANSGKKKPDPGMLASVQILAAVHASFFTASSNMTFEANDLIDAQHAAVGLPYCDFLFVDKPLSHRLNTKPLDFGQVYGKPITGDPVEFLAWLEKL